MTSDCLFCRMATGEVSVAKHHDDDLVFALHDINPRAPVHLLIIPKRHIPTVREIADGDGLVLARMFAVANRVADMDGIGGSGYRLAFNYGEDAGMSIPHLHLHVLGGRQLGPEG